uniref:ADPribosylation factor GTPaseactivating protein puta n=1 Tax=Albugo laibachii Nc14 TaxID=890382 RepID=F0WJE6_9STRA|nr:ADPribosylation factor GTPaseactivating protein puta [Albugo laibachii Nc14]|eukprot:CCA21394.1 ADPribosylation factor GTPaseactivating protein puta [Albugo laibachii Nc14]
MGNKKSNEKFENGLPSQQLKPQFDSSWGEREAFIRAKYEKQLFCLGAGVIEPNQQGIDTLPQQTNCISGHTFALTSEQTLQVLQNCSTAPRKSSSTCGMVEYIGVLIIELIEGVDVSKYHKNDRSDLYVTLRLGEQMITSNTIKNDSKPRWNQKLLLSWDGLSALKVELYDRKRFHSSRSLGGFIVEPDLLQVLIEAKSDGSHVESNGQSSAIDSWHQVLLMTDERKRCDMHPSCPKNHNVPLYPHSSMNESAHEPLRKMLQKMSKNVAIRKLLRTRERTDKTVGLIHLRLALQKF